MVKILGKSKGENLWTFFTDLYHCGAVPRSRNFHFGAQATFQNTRRGTDVSRKVKILATYYIFMYNAQNLQIIRLSHDLYIKVVCQRVPWFSTLVLFKSGENFEICEYFLQLLEKLVKSVICLHFTIWPLLNSRKIFRIFIFR